MTDLSGKRIGCAMTGSFCTFKAVFEASHALKGSTGNLSLTPLFDPLNELCELVRPENIEDGKDYAALCAPLAQTIEEKRSQLATLL